MGKDLRNRNIGKGLSQRKDGYYSARFVDSTGKRVERYFDSLPAARSWLEEAKHLDKHETVIPPIETVAEDIIENDAPLNKLNNMTVDEWFEFWLTNIVPDLAYNTRRNYKERYKFNIQPVIGKLKVKDVLPLHCKKIFLDMEKEYAGSTIRQVYIALGTLFKAALMNGIISKHPLDGVRYSAPIKDKSDVKVLEVDEQEKFLEQAKRSHNYDQYVLLLETGLRTGEMVGLTWDAVDFENKTLTVNKTLEYRFSTKEWRAGSPKTISSYRTIPLTETAYTLLKKRYYARDSRYEAKELAQILEFKDRLTGKMRYLDMKALVFVNYRTGMPSKNSSYDTHLYKLCDEAGIKPFCMHVLRHTYATRAIERGVNPKVLQKLLGHASVQVTMDTYVHVTDLSMLQAVRLFEGK